MNILRNRYKAAYERSKPSDSNERELHRFLFLDFDGVLSTIRHADFLIDHDEDEYDEFEAIFDPEGVANLTYIINKVPDLKIVISSTWRFKGWEWLNRMWEKRQMPGKLFSITPALDFICFKNLMDQSNHHSTFPYGIKGLEIDEWLKQNVNREDLYYYAILDDNIHFSTHQAQYAAFCNPCDGLTKELAKRVIEILHVEYEEEIKHIINLDKMPHSNNPIRHLDVDIDEKGRPSLRGLGKDKKQ